MSPREAIRHAAELNQTGKHRAEWFYFPSYHSKRRDWHVARRDRYAEIHTAIFANGALSGLEVLDE